MFVKFARGLGLSVVLMGAVGFANHQGKTTDDLKNEIIELSLKNTEDESTREEVRNQLEALIADLVARVGEVDEVRIAQFSAGSWRQIWSDEADNFPPGSPTRDLKQIYQVIFPEGWGYNFGVRNLSPDVSVTFALQAQATVQGRDQITEITRAYSRPTGWKLSKRSNWSHLTAPRFRIGCLA